MCRHFAWLGHERTVEQLVLLPSYGLPRQGDRPRWQQIELVNRDGFGVGWFTGENTVTYRRTGPIEADPDFPELARSVSGGCVIGAVRGASPGMPIEVEATAPFTNGRALVSLNGHVSTRLTASMLDPAYEPESTCDAAFLATLLWQRLDAGIPLTTAVPSLVQDVARVDANACLNLLATDGMTIVATTWGETLCYRTGPSGTLVASEPHDDDADWITVPDRHLLIADPVGVSTHALPALDPSQVVDPL
ncbi:class II glutamine amidotransferase [Actinocorallia longicatena]|uniref:Ergothioneine biosynthesis protein EgtC n=1 Tax=Actinocorallia longicatena TaxID=111803 RepID=A0ABP6QGG4_9ACTN